MDPTTFLHGVTEKYYRTQVVFLTDEYGYGIVLSIRIEQSDQGPKSNPRKTWLQVLKKLVDRSITRDGKPLSVPLPGNEESIQINCYSPAFTVFFLSNNYALITRGVSDGADREECPRSICFPARKRQPLSCDGRTSTSKVCSYLY